MLSLGSYHVVTKSFGLGRGEGEVALAKNVEELLFSSSSLLSECNVNIVVELANRLRNIKKVSVFFDKVDCMVHGFYFRK